MKHLLEKAPKRSRRGGVLRVAASVALATSLSVACAGEVSSPSGAPQVTASAETTPKTPMPADIQAVLQKVATEKGSEVAQRIQDKDYKQIFEGKIGDKTLRIAAIDGVRTPDGQQVANAVTTYHVLAEKRPVFEIPVVLADKSRRVVGGNSLQITANPSGKDMLIIFAPNSLIGTDQTGGPAAFTSTFQPDINVSFLPADLPQQSVIEAMNTEACQTTTDVEITNATQFGEQATSLRMVAQEAVCNGWARARSHSQGGDPYTSYMAQAPQNSLMVTSPNSDGQSFFATIPYVDEIAYNAFKTGIPAKVEFIYPPITE